jgi:putative ABC transport system permease protein
MGTIGLVMLIACANVINLLLVRTESRQHQLAVRAALGAGWTRILQERLVESALPASMGGVLGVALAYGGLKVLISISRSGSPGSYAAGERRADDSHVRSHAQRGPRLH